MSSTSRKGPPHFDTPLQKAVLVVVACSVVGVGLMIAGLDYPGSTAVPYVCFGAGLVVAVLILIKRVKTGSWE